MACLGTNWWWIGISACNLVIGMAWHGLASIELGVKIAFRGDTLSFLALFTCQHLEGEYWQKGWQKGKEDAP